MSALRAGSEPPLSTADGVVDAARALLDKLAARARTVSSDEGFSRSPLRNLAAWVHSTFKMNGVALDARLGELEASQRARQGDYPAAVAQADICFQLKLRMDVGVFSASGGNGGSAESARHTKVVHERAAANMMCRGRYQDIDDHREALTRATTALKSKLCGVSNDQWCFAPSLNAQHNGHEALNKRKRSAAADEVVGKEADDAEEQQREQQRHEKRQVCIPQPHLHYVSPVRPFLHYTSPVRPHDLHYVSPV
jgi:hypothetical protein